MDTTTPRPPRSAIPRVSGETRRQLLDALLCLPEELRQAVVLRDMDRLSCAEISRRLGCPVAIVKTQVNQARLQLYRYLQLHGWE